ncbi:MAG: iron-sulfur cluster assembly accessory protein [Alphaproteobacteria bacterium]
MTEQAITLTDAAATRVKEMMAGLAEPVLGLRVGVKTAGCSGLAYVLEYATEQRDNEDVIEDKGVKLFVDPKALMFLIGTRMDYRDGKMGSSFVFSNPNETGRCGCGESFRV